MAFIKDSANRTPIVDNVFAIVEKAKKAEAEFGKDAVVNATIGSLYGEDGTLVAMDVVYDTLKGIDNKKLAAYAASFVGNPAFIKDVSGWVLDGHSRLCEEIIATPGGTGAVGMSIENTLEPGQTLIIPEIAWGSYALMAQMNNLEVARYNLFRDGKFDVESLKETCRKVMEKQDKLTLIINDPCHNPTGYSLSDEEWKEVISFLNECSKTHPVILINDIAYIDFSYRKKQARDYMENFNDISDGVVVCIAFSISKSMTSYGLRCGAVIILAQKEEAVHEMKVVLEKQARAIWSNINNGAMEMFSQIMENKADEYEKEKDYYVDLLKQRTDLFVKEAKEAGLSHYPYKEGFFVTLDMDNEKAAKLHQALMDENIFTVKVNKGIRVALCSLPLDKVRGLARKIKDVELKTFA